MFFWLVVGLILIFSPGKLIFVDQKILGMDKNLLGVFLGSLILFIAGLWDDFRGLKPGYKLLWQIIAASLVVIFGVKIWWFSNPIGGLNIVLDNWTYLIVPLWIVLIVNVLNWLDGLDGLADGVSVITLIVVAILSATPLVNQPATAILCLILAGASLGFLPFNFNPAKIFLGDSGSMFLGFMIAVAAIISGAKLATVVLILGIPILDAVWVILRRIFSGHSPFKADRLHLHHRFLEAGFSQRKIVLIVYALCAIFGVIALANSTGGKMVAIWWLVAVMVIIGVSLVIIRSRKKNTNIKT
ncbi:MAG: undecaprenyl/decaprenyl-phosphate alpha-N-acetylglucosaminyl 1-phosphate transferase [Patescibacteria group bacterium]|nr:undecaprenyl/decaprenyl-phosphate alpha-N-acetylglucosaminyl 1-phosphate transferase [Patescibacteria group bacterium]